MGRERGGALSQLEQRRRRTELAGDDRAGAYARRQLRHGQLAWLRRNWRGVALLVALFGFLLALDLTILWRPLRPYAVGATVTAFGWVLHVLLLQTGDVLRWQAGIDAELRTAQTLRTMQRQGWHLINHVPTDGGDIDHALIGPGGYFAVETKYRSRWSSDHTALAPVVRQALVAARRLGARLHLGTRARATPLVVAWGSGCEEAFPQPVDLDGVLFVAGPQIRRTLSALPAMVSDAEIDAAYAALDSYLHRVGPREQAEQGPVPTTIAGLVESTTMALVAAFAAAMLVTLTISLPPTGWWSVPVALAIVAISMVARHRLEATRRTRHLITAVIVGAGSVGSLLLGVLVISAVPL